MKTKQRTYQIGLRFTRWSRAGYAAFCSLGKCVSIGALRADMGDRSLEKQVGFVEFCFNPDFSELNDGDEVDEALQFQAVSLLSVMPVQQVAKVVASFSAKKSAIVL